MIVENTTNNNQSSEKPTQNELDLDFNRMEPITPKKIVSPKSSFFSKARNLFDKKSATEKVNQFAVRKDFEERQQTVATDNNSATANEHEPFATSASNNAAAETAANSAAAESEFTNESTTKNNGTADNLAAAAESIKSKVKKPEDWAMMQKLPPKHRRLVIAIVGIIVILAALLWLKPSKDTVEDFQADNGNTLPIEFQPLDQSQAPENAEANNIVTPPEGNGEQPADAGQATVKSSQSNPAQSNAEQTAPTSTTPVQSIPVPPAPQTSVPAKPIEHNKPTPAEKSRHAQANKTVENKAEAKTKSAAAKPTDRKIPIVDAKPVNVGSTVSQAQAKAKPAPVSGSAKTLTVPQGTSLMQVFRDNNLNISDVNAMTKANGANGVLSSFKPGDKVQVVVNGQGRVSTMRLSNGSTFTRQADGTYRYSK